jgi:hypothetical protein
VKISKRDTYLRVDDADARIAIYILDPDQPSGCIEWPLIGWSVGPEGRWPAVPANEPDEKLEEAIWADLYALWDIDSWVFPDGERCDDENLIAAFGRRQPGKKPKSIASRRKH